METNYNKINEKCKIYILNIILSAVHPFVPCTWPAVEVQFSIRKKFNCFPNIKLIMSAKNDLQNLLSIRKSIVSCHCIEVQNQEINHQCF